MRSVLVSAAAAVLVLAGCGAKEDASLLVYTRNATLTKGANAFGSKLDGGVEIVFDLGKYTQESVKVEGIQLGIYRGTTQVVPTATIAPTANTTFPVDLAPGQKHVIAYTISRPQLLPDEVTALCAGPVTLTGAVKQAGKGELQVVSDPITVAGCP